MNLIKNNTLGIRLMSYLSRSRLSIFIKFFILSNLLFIPSLTQAIDSHNSDSASNSNKKIIAIVAPMQHQAMDEIVEGFKQALNTADNKDQPLLYTVEVFNSMGNSNTLHSIMLKLANNDDYAIIAPIGKTATQMATSLINNKPIIGLAVNMKEEDRKKYRNFTFVNDEVCMGHSLALIQALGYKNITLIYSNDDRIFNGVKLAHKLAKQKDINNIQEIAVNNAAEIYSLIKNIDDKSEALVIMKDHLIVANIKALTQVAHKRNIPVITADEGSIISGADMGLGVEEKAIGVKGAQIAISILAGQNIDNIAGSTLTDALLLFYNKNSTAINQQKANEVAQKLKYQLEIIN